MLILLYFNSNKVQNNAKIYLSELSGIILNINTESYPFHQTVKSVGHEKKTNSTPFKFYYSERD